MRYPESESSVLEFKSQVPKNQQIAKTIIGFCNQAGGKLVIGVANDRRIIGVPDDQIEQLLESIEQAIYQTAAPPIIPRVSVRLFENKSIIVIEVSAGMNKPYYLKSEGLDRGAFVRIGRSTLRATPEVLQELRWQTMGVSFEDLPVYRANDKELDQGRILKFLKERQNHGIVNLSHEVLQAYHLTVTEHSQSYPTTAGVLLFGTRPQYFFSEAMIIATHFQGTEGREAIASVDCEGTLFDQFHQCHNFILSRLHRSFSIKGVKREEVLEIPEVALREALLNAVIHRNYHLRAPTKVAIFDDRIEIFSPGQFSGLMDTNNLKAGVTYLRNPAICKVFREAGYVEKLGTGWITMMNSYQEWGLALPRVIEGANFIKCILPRKPAPQRVMTGLDEVREIFLQGKELTMKDLLGQLPQSRATLGRYLRQLIESGEIEKIGQRRNVSYRRKF